MARTSIRGIATPKPTIEIHKNHTIETIGNDVFVVLSEDNKRKVRNIEQAKMFIGNLKKDDKISGPHGGYLKNPPVDCPNRVSDKEGYWVDACICAHRCKDVACRAYIFLMEGSKTRVRISNSDPLPITCPYCQSGVKEVSFDFTTTTYLCGTIGDRLHKEYNRKCKPPQTTRRRTR